MKIKCFKLGYRKVMALSAFLLLSGASGQNSGCQKTSGFTAEDLNGVELSVKKKYPVSGRILDQNKAPVGLASIKIGDRTSSSDEQGQFFLSDVQEGSYLISVLKQGFLDFESTVVINADSQVIQDITLLSMDDKGQTKQELMSASGFVYEVGTNRPITNASLFFKPITPSGAGVPTTAFSSDFGFFYIENLTVGSYEIEVTAPGYLPTARTQTIVKSDNSRIPPFYLALSSEPKNNAVLTQLKGVVIDNNTNKPIPGAKVEFMGQATYTHPNTGEYSFFIDPLFCKEGSKLQLLDAVIKVSTPDYFSFVGLPPKIVLNSAALDVPSHRCVNNLIAAAYGNSANSSPVEIKLHPKSADVVPLPRTVDETLNPPVLLTPYFSDFFDLADSHFLGEVTIFTPQKDKSILGYEVIASRCSVSPIDHKEECYDTFYKEVFNAGNGDYQNFTVSFPERIRANPKSKIEIIVKAYGDKKESPFASVFVYYFNNKQ